MFFQKIPLVPISNPFYGLSIICMNIWVYITLLFLFFALLFLFDLTKIKTLTDIKIFNKNVFLSVTTVILFLSMSGIPPLAGFGGKFLILNFLFFLKKFFLIFLFSILNFFSIYFYIQNIRFIISKTFLNCFLVGGFYYFLNLSLVGVLVFLNFFNFFGILYFEDFLYIFISIFLYKNLF